MLCAVSCLDRGLFRRNDEVRTEHFGKDELLLSMKPPVIEVISF
jgi:hypothetical protein